MPAQPTPTIARLAESEPVSFGPLSHYNTLHWHPYVEYLFVLEGLLEAWIEGQQDTPNRLGAGDMIALPANTPHVFRNPGPATLRLLGIHHSPERVVNRIEDAAMPV
jgi:mannose-6-phosphate isomerase-like protein (cupin superfamily)